jgi:hypothetical protein
MAAGTVALSTIGICLLAATAELVLGCTSTASLTADDAVVLPLLLGRYVLLCLFAWWQRRARAASWLLLALAGALAAWALYVSGVDNYRYHTEPDYRKVQRVAVFVVPLLQWVVVLVVGLVMLVLWWVSRRGAGRADHEGMD